MKIRISFVVYLCITLIQSFIPLHFIYAEFKGVTLLSMGLNDNGTGEATDTAIDTIQKLCDPETDDYEPFFQTELVAKVKNTLESDVLVRFAKVKAVDPTTGNVVWKSAILPGTYTNIPRNGTQDFITVIAHQVDIYKYFILSEIALHTLPQALNIKVRLNIRDSTGKKSRIRASLLMVPAEIDNC